MKRKLLIFASFLTLWGGNANAITLNNPTDRNITFEIYLETAEGSQLIGSYPLRKGCYRYGIADLLRRVGEQGILNISLHDINRGTLISLCQGQPINDQTINQIDCKTVTYEFPRDRRRGDRSLSCNVTG
ncbi:MAG: hypothetical protein H0X26_02225 [Alphaproteobacteria bacterium]|nr:hypothetical protein [Alphaproteobacteria bacterium]